VSTTEAIHFTATTCPNTLALVLTKEPDWDALPDELPRTLRPFLERCLEKDCGSRLRDVGDLRLAMEGRLEATPSKAPGGDSPARARRASAALVIGLVLGSLLMIAVGIATRPNFEPGESLLLFARSFQSGQDAGSGNPFINYDVAPDGRFVMVKSEPVPQRLTVVESWTSVLEERRPNR